MNCEAMKDSMPLFLYRELSFDEEESFEQHMAVCEACRVELVRVRKLQDLISEASITPSLPLLAECRHELRSNLGPQSSTAASRSVWSWLPQISIHMPGAASGSSGVESTWMRPLAAMALVAVGFFSAKAPLFDSGANLAGVTASRVRTIEPDREGRVQIVVDETRQRVLSGRLDDEHIRMLMISASREQSDPGLRAESVELLKSRVGSNDVREALLQALQHDSNSGVRLKALEGLRPFAAQPEVRKALSHTLLTDDTPAIRTQAIDLLMASHPSESIGVLQQLMEKEQDNYIRLRTMKALHEMNASAGTF